MSFTLGLDSVSDLNLIQRKLQATLHRQDGAKIKGKTLGHKTSVRNNQKNVVGQHFNGPGHSLDNLKITAIEKVFKRGTETILKTESLVMDKFV